MDNRLSRLSSEVRKVEREEKDLQHKEQDLEKKEKDLETKQKESWGEQEGGEVVSEIEIPMPIMMPHLPPPPEIAIGSMFGSLGDLLRERLESIKKTGPVEHSHHPVLPHNIFKPGAHPALSSSKDSKKSEKKEKKETEETNKGMKPIRIE